MDMRDISVFAPILETMTEAEKRLQEIFDLNPDVPFVKEGKVMTAKDIIEDVTNWWVGDRANKSLYTSLNATINLITSDDRYKVPIPGEEEDGGHACQ